MKLKLTLELLSDALPGSGESEAGIVDRDVLFDRFGLPEVPAKRIKGIIISSARDLADWKMLNNNEIDKIFGAEGASKTIFRISNGTMGKYKIFRDFLNFCQEYSKLSKIFDKHSVQKFFSYNRTQTSVMRKRSVAKENSLRISRVLRKGLKFHFNIDVDIDEVNEFNKFKEDFKKICNITKNFGSSRTRGLGEISLEVIDQQIQNNSSDKVELKAFGDEDDCVINLNLTNEEQLLVSNLINGQTTSELFIRGSYILGALARIYIKVKSLSTNAHTNPEFRNIFLSGKVNFTNFYPSVNGNIFHPVPFSIVREKGKEKYFDLSYEPDLERVMDREKGIQTELFGGFSNINSSKMQNFILSTKIESHNRRPRDRKIGHAIKNERQPVDITGAYFHYDVLEPNFNFKGQIIGKFKDLRNLIEILPKEMVIYVGKSKTAQYGKCLLEVKSVEKYERIIQNIGTDQLVITLTSDMILTNDGGHLTPDPEILREEIEKALGININETDKQNSYLKFTKVGGYNTTWGLPKIQGQALAAGSVIVLKREDGQKFNVEKLDKFAFGLRTSEGYGQVSVNTHGFSHIEKVNLEKKTSRDVLLLKNINLLKEFIEFCLMESLKSTISKKVFDIINSSKYNRIKVSGSFLQRLFIFIKSSNSINEFNKKLEHLKDNALNQLKMIEKELYIKNKKVNEEDFNKFLEKLSNDQIDFDSFKDTEVAKIFEDLEITKYYSRKTTELYNIYCSSFITNLILKTREVRKIE